jgi:iron complex outermembrane receptor protein
MRIPLLLSGLLWSTSVFAQDADIVVTATKEPAPADTLPVPVVVLGPDDLAGKTSVSDALSDTLAVRLQSQTPGQPALLAPGFGENGLGRISLLLDGMSQDNPDQNVPLLNLVPVFALDRIEIDRSPASAMYGTGAVGGAVNLITKTPTKFELQTSAGAEIGGTNRQSVALGVPVGQGGLLVSLQRDQELPSRDRTDNDEYQGWTKLSMPYGDQKTEVWLAFARSYAQLPGSLTLAEYKADPDQAVNPDDFTITTQTSGGASWSLDQDTWKLTVPVSMRVRSLQFSSPSVLPYGVPYTGSSLVTGTFEPRFTVDGNWVGAAVQWSGGMGVSVDHLNAKQYSDSGFSDTSFSATVDRLTSSVWNRGQFDWNDHWYLSADLRLETSATTANSTSDSTVDGGKMFWPISGDIGLTWLPSQEWKLAVDLSRVYRYPFVDEMVWYSGFGNQFVSNIDAEVGHGATLSASYSVGPWSISASGTLLRMENEVSYVSVPLPYGTETNLGPVWHASSLVGLSWKNSLTDTSILVLNAQFEGERAVFADGANEGNTVPLIPTRRGRLSAQIDDHVLGTAEAGWTLSSSYYDGGDDTNTESQIPGKQSLDASVTIFLGSKQYLLKIYGQNLTDDRTPDYVYYGGYYPADGRVIGASFTWTL